MQNTQPVKKAFSCQYDSKIDQVEYLIKGQKKFPDIATYFKGYTTPLGIEVEVENIRNPFPKMIYWNPTEDGSLKINGVELVSCPLAGHNIDYALAELNKALANEECLWSHRTSIHVHIYVGDFSVEKLKLFTAMYAVLESLFFSQVDEVRRGNPFCYHIRDLEPANVRIGNAELKYCAFNLGTGINNYNTVEFRHMNGTGDVVQIRRWIQLIVKLHRFVQETNNKDIYKLISELNTTSQYMELVRQVFGKTSILFMTRDLKKDMEEGVLWAKVFLLGEK